MEQIKEHSVSSGLLSLKLISVQKESLHTSTFTGDREQKIIKHIKASPVCSDECTLPPTGQSV